MASEPLASPPGAWRSPGALGTFGLGLVISVAAGLASLAAFVLGSILLAGKWFPDLPYGRTLYRDYEAASRVLQDLLDVGLFSHGTMISLGILAAAPVVLLLTVLFSRGYAASPQDFLGLRWPTARQALAWTAASLALRYGLSALLEGMGVEVGDDSMLDQYRTALPLPLLYLAVVVAAPVTEEILFRGFLLEGWRRSRLGIVGAAVLTSALWTIGHSYAAPALIVIFFDGLLLAAARLRTGSTYLTIGIHGLVNLLVLVHVGWFLSHDGTEYFVQKGREHLGKEQYMEAFFAFKAAERHADGPCPECRLGIARVYMGDGEQEQADKALRSRIQLCRARSQGRLPAAVPAAAKPSASERTEPPKIIYWEPPAYPETARQRGDQRPVIVEAAIDEEGCVTEARMLRGAAPDLDAAALATVRHWVFLPATLEGRPVKARFPVEVPFQTADARK